MSMTPMNHSQAFLYCRMLMALLSIHQENCPKSLHSILHTPSHLIQLNSFYHSPSTSHFPNLFVHCFRRLRTRNVQYINIYIIHTPQRKNNSTIISFILRFNDLPKPPQTRCQVTVVSVAAVAMQPHSCSFPSRRKPAAVPRLCASAAPPTAR